MKTDIGEIQISNTLAISFGAQIPMQVANTPLGALERLNAAQAVKDAVDPKSKMRTIHASETVGYRVPREINRIVFQAMGEKDIVVEAPALR